MRQSLRIIRSAAWVAALAASSWPAPAGGQQPFGPERIVVPLTRPAEKASVEVSLVNGGVTVEAYDGKEVIVEARTRARDESRRERHSGAAAHVEKIAESVAESVVGGTGGRSERRREGEADVSGMKRIPNDSAGLTVEEDGNHVRVDAESWKQTIDIHLRVPAGTRLDLTCVNSGDIKVSGVQGEMELSNVNGSIEVTGAAGPVLADTVNGRVRVVFARLEGSQPMAFNTLNGNVDLTLPASVKANVELRSDNGEIFSDFEVALSTEPVKVEQERRDGKFRVVVEKGVRGAIGGGGRVIRITTFNGNILLRAAK